MGGANSDHHAMVLCDRCRDMRAGGSSLALLLRQIGEQLGHSGFHLETADCMAGCDRPVTVAFRARGKATYLFGDIDAERDAGSLLDFAQLYRSLGDGWCNEGQRPAGLRGKTLARIPADPEALR